MSSELTEIAAEVPAAAQESEVPAQDVPPAPAPEAASDANPAAAEDVPEAATEASAPVTGGVPPTPEGQEVAPGTENPNGAMPAVGQKRGREMTADEIANKMQKLITDITSEKYLSDLGEMDYLQKDENDDTPFSLWIIIPQGLVGSVIGKGGATIREVQKVTETTMALNREECAFLDPRERKLVISGSMKNVHLAQHIASRIMQETVVENGVQRFFEVLRFMVPHHSLKHIIGKGGSSLKEHQEACGVIIRLQSEQEMRPNAPGRILSITGTDASRTKAQYRICRQIQKSAQTLNVPPSPGSGQVQPPPQQYQQQQYQQPQYQQQQYQQPQYQQQQYQQQYQQPQYQQQQQQQQQQQYQGYYDHNGQWVQYDYNQQQQYNQQYQQQQYDQSAQQGQQGQQQPAGQEQQGTPAAQQGSAGGTTGNTEIMQYLMNNHINKVAIDPGNPTIPAQAEARQGKDLEVHIPNAAISRVIGKAGRSLQEIRQISGAEVRISNDVEMHTGQETRRAIISGTTDQMSYAKSLVNGKIGKWIASLTR